MNYDLYQPHELLKFEFLKRKEKNPRYSLRRFSEQLGIDPGRMSQYFKQKRRITPQAAKDIAEKLTESVELRQAFINSAVVSHLNPVVDNGDLNRHQILQEQFELISEPIHTDILSLFETCDFIDCDEWVARRLSVGIEQVQVAMSRLVQLGLLELKNGRRYPSQQNLSTPDGVPSQALQNGHKKSLNHIIEKLPEVPLEIRDLSSMTMAIDVSKLPEAKALIRQFRRRMAEFLESGKRGEVYELNIQLFPKTLKEKTK